jgi:cytochrome c oxidase cbb3-type subunit III
MKSPNKAIVISLVLLSTNASAQSATDYYFLAEPKSLLIALLIILLVAVMIVLPNVIETLLKLLKKNKGKTLLAIATFFGSSVRAEIINVEFYQKFDAYHFVIGLTIFIIILTLFTQLHLINQLANQLRGKKHKRERLTKWKLFIKKMTDAKDVEREADILLDHDYDGIKELDNNLPPWWIYSFYISIIAAIIYMGHYHVFKTGDLMIAEYEHEILEAQQKLEEKRSSGDLIIIDESNVELLTDAKSLETGAKLFSSVCAACHASEGQGLVGPNLTDAYWIHGGEFKEIFSTIKYGVPEKGMIAWKSQLSPSQMQKVASFIMSLKGSTPLNPKAPEGDLVE